ncbi:MAG: PadR family transcriptional regulator [Gemmatimonadetes bacterium]|nr:PadR family transcriptional regulator [Gemmatimonadota bacterium]
MADRRTDVLQGTFDLLVLKVLSVEPIHGWGITQRIEALSERALSVNQGSLYPSLERLQRSGWVVSEWRLTENNRRAKYYRLTAAGRSQLQVERSEWERAAQAIRLILRWEGA